MKYIKLFGQHSQYASAESSLVKPNVSVCEQENEVHYNPITHDFSQDYFTTTALENGTIAFTIIKEINTDALQSISYSTNGGEDWTTVSNTDDKEDDLSVSVNVSQGDSVLWKGEGSRLGCEFQIFMTTMIKGCSFRESTARFDVAGNVMSLIYGDNFVNQNELEENLTFSCLFSNCETLVSAENLSLPATTLSNKCYAEMFYDCISLTVAPELPATTLANRCYDSMFQNCSGLTTAPATLPATTLASNCYYEMFYGCSSLTTAPELPATTLALSCYSSMFFNCTSLTTAPSILPATTLATNCYNSMFASCTSLTTAPGISATTLADYCCMSMFASCTSLTTAPSILPATTLTESCYSGMFGGCTSLTAAPELPAPTLVDTCYFDMFNGCTSLNYIKCMATDITVEYCTGFWLKDVAATGTFVKPSSMSSWTTGDSGIPTNWTVQNASS